LSQADFWDTTLEKQVKNGGFYTMDDIDMKLKQITVSVWHAGQGTFEHPLTEQNIEQIKQAFRDAGWHQPKKGNKGIFVTADDGSKWEIIRPPIPLGETQTPSHFVLRVPFTGTI
jgi:hypothetical protein